MDKVRITESRQVRSKTGILLDTGEQFWLSTKEADAHQFYEGQVMDADEFRREIRIIQYPKALDQAVAMLARRACSKKEIRQNLKRNKYCEEVTDLVLYKLEKEKLVNDSDFCEQWIQYRINAKYGRNRIIQELKQKGINEETIQDTFERLDHSEEKNNAEKLAAKLWDRRKSDEPIHKTRQRVVQSLVRKGYDWETAKEASMKAESIINM